MNDMLHFNSFTYKTVHFVKLFLLSWIVLSLLSVIICHHRKVSVNKCKYRKTLLAASHRFDSNYIKMIFIHSYNHVHS